ncbi:MULTISPECIES: class I SAM-dependent methyltransferase [Turicibacter]|uniref:class I SAM-dependent methyltransferase n=1 Tax=Turicibacter TaxID=191303 RepID=UPI0018AA7939|nr:MULTISPECIES: class I SAM-dependent methyltransferase [Turicibacter]MBP3904431.1 class I SAM-dependent methyltransferase [Turicibacter sp.]MDB8559554.1 class I SAM-dependent methyltransferase [Turicibacter sanguinis]MDB8562325.1 class I SAM-dependent methyltransferase [Turicibacter sanguinis]MDB8566550.1 class I SAM-dependent methyltransferase [Turicibacter sanguinis]MDB8569301.1 class I SAM-dependent methyltransferase [Turicibacter sanguinis]
MKEAFNKKAKDYANGRPSYPVEVLNKLIDLGVKETSTIADIGAGTGLLTNMLCELGCHVYAIEPNDEMLNECKKYCASQTKLKCVCASAEKTTLEENSVDVITVAQAFHWFDKEQCRIEFKRILKENGYVVTVWNSLEEDSAFIKEYVEIIHRYEIKMTAGNLYFNPDEEKLKFLGQDFVKAYFDNYQTATLEALISNVSSISYMPSKSDDRYTEMVEELTHLFNKYQQNGTVTFHYKTEVCIGQFAS